MDVLLLTAFISLILVAFFLALFVRERSGGRSISGSEQDALLPLDDSEAEGDGQSKD